MTGSTFLIGTVFVLASLVGLSTVAVVGVRSRRRRAERIRQERSADARRTLLALVADDDADEAVHDLRSLDRPVREALEPTAVSMLAKVRGDSRDALVQLLEDWGALGRATAGLSSRRAATRASAAELIGYTGRADLGACLPPLLHDPVAHVRRTAVRALGRIGDPSSAQPIVDALHHDDELPVGIAGQALLRIGPPAGPALVGGLASPRAAVRAMSATLLGLLGSPATVDRLMPLLADESPSVAAAAATALGHLGPPSALGPLIAATFGSPDEVRAAAVTALGRLGAGGATGTLRRLASDPVHEVAHNSAQALALLGDAGRDALAELRRAGGRAAAHAEEAMTA